MVGQVGVNPERGAAIDRRAALFTRGMLGVSICFALLAAGLGVAVVYLLPEWVLSSIGEGHARPRPPVPAAGEFWARLVPGLVLGAFTQRYLPGAFTKAIEWARSGKTPLSQFCRLAAAAAQGLLAAVFVLLISFTAGSVVHSLLLAAEAALRP